MNGLKLYVAQARAALEQLQAYIEALDMAGSVMEAMDPASVEALGNPENPMRKYGDAVLTHAAKAMEIANQRHDLASEIWEAATSGDDDKMIAVLKKYTSD